MREQGQRLESLIEADRPHVEARWVLLADILKPTHVGKNQDVRGGLGGEPRVTLATGASLPVSLYRGSSKKKTGRLWIATSCTRDAWTC